MNKLLAIAASLLLAACLDTEATDGVPTTDVSIVSDDPTTNDTSADDGRGLARTEEHQTTVCDQVVATDGPCAVACEPEKLIAFIPNGTCVTFVCDLEDGSVWRTGGCNW